MTDPGRAAYAASRLAWREANDLPKPLEGYGGRGSSATGKLLLTMPIRAAVYLPGKDAA